MRFAIPSWVILVAVSVALFTTIPVLVGYAQSNPNTALFNGFEFQEDFHAYAGYVESGVSGNPFLLVDKSTSEIQDGRYVIVYFTLLAALVRVTHLPIDVVWNAARFLVIVVLLLMFWKLYTRVLPRAETRTSAYLLLAFGGGLGWIVPVLGKFIPAVANLYSTDLTYALGYTLIGFAFHPLAMFGLIFFVGMVLFLLDFWEHEKEQEILGASACALMVFFNHPAAGVVAWIVLGSVLAYHTLSRRKLSFTTSVLAPWIPPLVGGSVILLYTLWARQDPVYLFHQSYYLEWAKQEPLIGYVLGLGLPLLFAGMAFLQKNPFELTSKGARGVFFAWLAISLALSFFLPAGVKYLYLVWPALAFYAALDFAFVGHWLERNIRFLSWRAHTWVAIFLVFSCLSAPFLLEKRMDEARAPAYYITPSQDAGLRFLAAQTNGIVLSEYSIGSMLAWRTPLLPYVAHGFLTIDFKSKREAVAHWFNSGTPIAEKIQFLQDNRIAYVFTGPDEMELGGVNPSLGLILVFESGDVRIYRVPPAFGTATT